MCWFVGGLYAGKLPPLAAVGHIVVIPASFLSSSSSQFMLIDINVNSCPINVEFARDIPSDLIWFCLVLYCLWSVITLNFFSVTRHARFEDDDDKITRLRLKPKRWWGNNQHAIFTTTSRCTITTKYICCCCCCVVVTTSFESNMKSFP